MREDAGFRRRVENTDIRMTQRIADVLERRDREEQERKCSQTAPEQPIGSDQDHTVKGHSPEVAERVRSESHGGASSSGIPTEEDVVMGDDMGIPLATDDVVGSEAKEEEGRCRGFWSTKGRETEAGVHVPLGGVRHSSMSVRSSVDFGYAYLQEICLKEQASF